MFPEFSVCIIRLHKVPLKVLNLDTLERISDSTEDLLWNDKKLQLITYVPCKFIL